MLHLDVVYFTLLHRYLYINDIFCVHTYIYLYILIHQKGLLILNILLTRQKKKKKEMALK